MPVCTHGHDMNFCPLCLPMYYGKYYGQIGWICPKCGRGNAPSNMMCGCVPNTNVSRDE